MSNDVVSISARIGDGKQDIPKAMLRDVYFRDHSVRRGGRHGNFMKRGCACQLQSRRGIPQEVS